VLVACRQGKVSVFSQGGRRLQQGYSYTPPPPGPMPPSTVQMGMTPAQAGAKSGYFGQVMTDTVNPRCCIHLFP
jgi:hypothetical protein